MRSLIIVLALGGCAAQHVVEPYDPDRVDQGFEPCLHATGEHDAPLFCGDGSYCASNFATLDPAMGFCALHCEAAGVHDDCPDGSSCTVLSPASGGVPICVVADFHWRETAWPPQWHGRETL